VRGHGRRRSHETDDGGFQFRFGDRALPRGQRIQSTVARIDDIGQAIVVATGDTPQGARNPVADAEGNAYEADAANGRLLVFSRRQW